MERVKRKEKRNYEAKKATKKKKNSTNQRKAEFIFFSCSKRKNTFISCYIGFSTLYKFNKKKKWASFSFKHPSRPFETFAINSSHLTSGFTFEKDSFVRFIFDLYSSSLKKSAFRQNSSLKMKTFY